MNLLPPPNIIQIFIRNRTAQGWPQERIATALRTRLRWDVLDPKMMSEEQRERYEATAELLGELEVR